MRYASTHADLHVAAPAAHDQPWAPERAAERLPAQLEGFAWASETRLKENALLRRVDTKFVCSRAQLALILRALRPHYALVGHAGHVLGRYRSVYFDTADMQMFHDHRRGRRPRHKVRIRQYLRRRVAYFEIKTKGRDDRTDKWRRPRAFAAQSADQPLTQSRTRSPAGDAHPYTTPMLDVGEAVALHARLGLAPSALAPVVTLDFPRITLVATEAAERITLDLGLTAHARQRTASFADIVIAELKQPRFDANSVGMRAFRTAGLRPFRVSKYCTAVVALGLSDRVQRFLPALRELKRCRHA